MPLPPPLPLPVPFSPQCQRTVLPPAVSQGSPTPRPSTPRCGEACLICYLQPLELTRAARAERLLQFDFGCEHERAHAQLEPKGEVSVLAGSL